MSRPQVTVVGAGQVGATTAHLLALKGLTDVVLIDVVEGLAQGKALDLMESAPVEGFPGTVRGTTDLEAMAGSRLVVITAGQARKPGMSREDLLAANARIVGPIAAKTAAVAPEATLLMVTNPLDIMVGLAKQRTGFPRERVLGMAGVLDSARLRYFIAERLRVPPVAVSAIVLGSHGDLMVPVVSSITVEGQPVTKRLSPAELDALLKRTKDGGAEIVKLLKQGSAFYAPATGVVQMARAILQNTNEVLPVCAWLEGEYGLRDVCVGVPAELGHRGIQRIVELELADDEHRALTACAESVRQGLASLAKVATP